MQAEGREYYRCGGCGYDDSRLIMLYPQMRYRILPDSELLHYSVGAVIEWEGKILLFHRRLFPFCYTIVAGHWDLDDETPEIAIAREIREEAGIEICPEKAGIGRDLRRTVPARRGFPRMAIIPGDGRSEYSDAVRRSGYYWVVRP